MKLFVCLRKAVYGLFVLFLLTSCGGGGGGSSLTNSEPDTTAPDTTITSAPDTTSSTSSASFEFSATESGSTFEISVDGGTYVSASSPRLISGLSEGGHEIKVRAIDSAGNTDATPAIHSWTVVYPTITVSTCSYTSGDSTQDPGTGRAIFTKSHTLGSPLYRVVTPRQLANGSDITVDYMVHEPSGTAKGIVVLIAGGDLNAGIEGTTDGSAPTNSRGNFLVRSAHRYQAQGYRAITIDRPSDYASYGAFAVDLDDYRNSMQHAVDIATIVKRENSDNLNVIISGTSRGAISAAAMNTLAAGISMSSPLTGGSTGHPVGSSKLPLTKIKRPSHVMLHTNDTCAYTLPAETRNLFENLIDTGNAIGGNEVSGGFRDTDRNDVCGGFDYHGFAGIEMCAVLKETSWMDSLMSGMGGNSPPQASSQSVSEGDAIKLSASDADGDDLSYSLPYTSSSLGGSVTTDSSGNVTYIAPVGVSGAVDTFAFSVTDGKGGVGTAVVSVTLN